MPHPRPTGTEESLAVQLRAATAEVHKEAEQRPFMRAFFAGTLPRPAYVEWLARQWHLYDALESGLRAIPEDAPGAGVVPEVLFRADRIAADLDHLTGGRWRDEDHLTPATLSYVERIRSASVSPPLLVVHAWLRYMGNVGGRDVLRRLASSSLGIDESSPDGLAFTDFSAVGEIRPFFAGFHAALDAMPLDEWDQDRLVEEADAGFRLNIRLTDELAEDLGIA